MKKKLLLSLTAVLLLFPINSVYADKEKNNEKDKSKPEEKIEEIKMPELDIESDSVLLYDINQKKIVYEKNIDKVIPTASLAKVMTLSIVSENLKGKKLKKSELVTVSEKAWKTGGSRMFIEVGKKIAVEELMKGIAVVSGNDAAVALSEHIHGSTDSFVGKMNEKAQKLKMTNTTFETVNGLPIDGLMDTSTARDLNLLTIDYLKKYPENLSIHKMESYAFDNGRNVIEQKNQNPLLKSYKGSDGLKTGWVEGHHNLIGTAEANGIRLIAIILSAPSSEARAQDAKKLLDYGFSQYRVYKFTEKEEVIEKVSVYKAKGVKSVKVAYKEKTEITLHSLEAQKIKENIDIPDHITGGKKKGDVIGSKKIYVGDKLIHTADIVVTEDLPKANLLTSMFDSIALIFSKITSKLF